MNFPRKNFFKRLLIALVILTLILLGVSFIINVKRVATAQNQIKVYPTSYSIEAFNDITWENPVNAFTQDLPDNASLSDFNKENSVFIGENIKQQEEMATTTETTVPAENTTVPESTTTTVLEETTT
ncbi:MAG: hypothetical protein GYA31_00905, partial [Parcubacteria group bacterium]|nr:hypothetical protein [Parcubacteria group bacterium]